MRKDRLSSFQAKKQKILKIKEKINTYNFYWKEVRENKLQGTATTYDPYNLINEIWELVKDE